MLCIMYVYSVQVLYLCFKFPEQRDGKRRKRKRKMMEIMRQMDRDNEIDGERERK